VRPFLCEEKSVGIGGKERPLKCLGSVSYGGVERTITLERKKACKKRRRERRGVRSLLGANGGEPGSSGCRGERRKYFQRRFSMWTLRCKGGEHVIKEEKEEATGEWL